MAVFGMDIFFVHFRVKLYVTEEMKKIIQTTTDNVLLTHVHDINDSPKKSELIIKPNFIQCIKSYELSPTEVRERLPVVHQNYLKEYGIAGVSIYEN